MAVIQATIMFLVVSSVHGKLDSPRCLTGQFHKSKPGPETSDYKACHAYRNSTCCTADFTKQLAVSPIVKIGNFSWTLCNMSRLSKPCEDYMKEVECFYQCSPNVGYWKGQFRGSFVGVPLCSSFCDSWFDACKNDLTCAKNWITDFDYDQNGNNKCKNPNCQSYSQVYKNGTELCNAMWGTSFKYTVSTKPNDCMHLTGINSGSDPNILKKNTMVAERYHSIHSGTASIAVSRGFATIPVLLWTILASIKAWL